ncbi:hypothetical protein [Bradyrhizobium sp.]|uniref:hypothetical protein n=1 Tax=Bradyrhizobium sp. TaxID=376 RepID=UPI003C16877D
MNEFIFAFTAEAYSATDGNIVLSHSLSNFSGLSLEDVMTNFAQFDAIDKTRTKAPDYDVPILFASGALTIVLLVAIYLASISAGTPAEQLVSMTVFP